MLPFDATYCDQEYRIKRRSISSIAKEWDVSTSSLYNFFLKNNIEIRSRAEATANAYEVGTRKNKEHTIETRHAIAAKMIEYHKNKTPKQKKNLSNKTKFNLQSKGRDWLRMWKKKGGRDANFSWRKATRVVDYIYDYFVANGYSPVLDRRPADIVLADNTAIIIDGYYRIKNYEKDGWVDARKKQLDEYGFKKIIYCTFNCSFSKGRAQDLLTKILEIGIISTDKEVIL